MNNFVFHTPTKVVFGKGTENEVGALVKAQNCRKVLVHFGGGSAKKSGLLDRIYASLDAAGVAYISLGGVVPNPRLSLVYEGIELCRREGVDFILAVGGGSVIDSSKAIGYGVANDFDVWDLFDRKNTAAACLPVGCVLTIAAAGSEMSDSTVITKDEGELKRGYNNSVCRCKFAVMNPELTYTLPAYQTACGVTDIMMHIMERYFVQDETLAVTDGMAESVIRTVLHCGAVLRDNPTDYKARAEVMWAGSLAHNSLMCCGGPNGDWASHQIEMELSGMFGVDLGQLGALRARRETRALRAVRAERVRHRARKRPESDGAQGHRGDGELLPLHPYADQYPRARAVLHPDVAQVPGLRHAPAAGPARDHRGTGGAARGCTGGAARGRPRRKARFHRGLHPGGRGGHRTGQPVCTACRNARGGGDRRCAPGGTARDRARLPPRAGISGRQPARGRPVRVVLQLRHDQGLLQCFHRADRSGFEPLL